MKKSHILLAAISWVGFFAIKILLMLLGFVVVPIALQWRKTEPVKTKDKQIYPSRRHVSLPKWAWVWDNEAEGAMSWMPSWPELCWDKNPESLLSMWQWLAVRNPSNNLKYVLGLAVNMLQIKEITLLYGVATQVSAKYNLQGIQFFTAKGKYFRYFNFHYAGKYIWIRFGHKIEPRHWVKKLKVGEPVKVSEIDLKEQETHRKIWKGMTFRFGLMSKYK